MRLIIIIMAFSGLVFTGLNRSASKEWPDDFQQIVRSRNVRPTASNSNDSQRRSRGVRQPAEDEQYRSLIEGIAREYQVPAGILYGIWKKESGWLESGWAKHWNLASTLPDADGPCVDRYNSKKCSRHWRALREICSQRRDGQAICDPYQVRVSYAGAMGPTQHMPAILLPGCDSSGGCRWSRHAQDYDRDGVIDPHSLPDALASTASHVRNSYNGSCHHSWQCAVNRYFGGDGNGYFEGTQNKKGVHYWWTQWCEINNCS